MPLTVPVILPNGTREIVAIPEMAIPALAAGKYFFCRAEMFYRLESRTGEHGETRIELREIIDRAEYMKRFARPKEKRIRPETFAQRKRALDRANARVKLLDMETI